ncbi:MAG: SRPBCC family protein [Acidimicrobiales bacterium]|nr:SRPBCC family protein [Acidimicrobiales bacterium]
MYLVLLLARQGPPIEDRLRPVSERPPGYGDRVKKLWVHRDIDAPAEILWALLTDLDCWPRWGPSVRHAQLDGGFQTGAVGVVTTVLGARLPFEITACEDGERWAWKVGGVPATDHTVRRLGAGRSRVGFGVPWLAAPYLAVCRVALGRLEATATQNRVAS